MRRAGVVVVGCLLLAAVACSSEGVDLDSDQRALDAYNATLAALHGRDRGEKHDR